MASFNAIVQQAAASDRAFYEERGVLLHNLEVLTLTLTPTPALTLARTLALTLARTLALTRTLPGARCATRTCA